MSASKAPVYIYRVEWKDDDSYMIQRGRIVKQNPRRVFIEWERPDGTWDYKRDVDTKYAPLQYSVDAAIEATRTRLSREVEHYEMRLREYRGHLEKLERLASEVLK